MPWLGQHCPVQAGSLVLMAGTHSRTILGQPPWIFSFHCSHTTCPNIQATTTSWLCRQRSTGRDVRLLVGYLLKETRLCCWPTSMVFSYACSDATYIFQGNMAMLLAHQWFSVMPVLYAGQPCMQDTHYHTPYQQQG